MLLTGNYNLNIKFGGNVVNITPQMIQELTITQDIERFLPTFRMTLLDPTRILSEILPFDKVINKVQIELSLSEDLSELNVFSFEVKRRKTGSEEVYDVEGVLELPDFITENRSKAFTGNLKNNLESIVSDLGIKTTEIGTSLSYNKNFIQPNWSDAKLFNYLKKEITGKNGESGYYCFFKVVRGEPIFVFKSLNELLISSVKHKFIIAPKAYEDCFPISNYQVFDNSQILADLGAKNQDYVYFDYANGTYIRDQINIDDCPSLSEFLLLDSDRSNSSVLYTKTGRSNDFTNFESRMKNDFFLRANNFIHMWATTWGLQNIAPGDIVKVVFGDSFTGGKLFAYQHSGYWMVKRVVHLVNSSFNTNLLLTRTGIDTETQNTLLTSTKQVKK